MRRIWVLAAAAPLLALAACSGATSSSTPADPGQVEAVPAPESGGTAAYRQGAPATDTQAATQQRDVVRTASVAVVVDDPQGAADRLATETATAGGYVQQVSTGTDPRPCGKAMDCPVAEGGPDPSGSGTGAPTTGDGVLLITVRVPAAKYDQMLGSIKGMGQIVSLTVSADDVTAQTQDLQARIVSQRASVERVRALMRQANTIDEVMRVEQELAQRQQDLEAMEAQQKRLADSVALATITAQFIGPDQVEALVPADTHWWDKPVNAFVTAWETLLIAIAALSPLLLLLAIAGVIALLILRRRRAAKSPATPATQDQPADQ